MDPACEPSVHLLLDAAEVAVGVFAQDGARVGGVRVLRRRAQHCQLADLMMRLGQEEQLKHPMSSVRHVTFSHWMLCACNTHTQAATAPCAGLPTTTDIANDMRLMTPVQLTTQMAVHAGSDSSSSLVVTRTAFVG